MESSAKIHGEGNRIVLEFDSLADALRLWKPWGDRIRRLEARCRELGWHLDFLGPGWLTEELLPVIFAPDRKLEYTVTGKYKGSQLKDIEYEQLIDWVKPDAGAFRVITGDFVCHSQEYLDALTEVIAAYRKQLQKGREEFVAAGDRGKDQVAELDFVDLAHHLRWRVDVGGRAFGLFVDRARAFVGTELGLIHTIDLASQKVTR